MFLDPLEPGSFLRTGLPATIAEQGIHQAHTLHPLGVANRVGPGYRPTPVLAYKGDVGQIEVVDKLLEVLYMGLQRIHAVLRRLRFPETHVVRNNHPVIFGQRRNKIAIQVAPGRLAMQTDHHLTVARPLVYVMLAEACGGTEMRRERPGAVEGLVCRDHTLGLLNRGSARAATAMASLERSGESIGEVFSSVSNLDT